MYITKVSWNHFHIDINGPDIQGQVTSTLTSPSSSKWHEICRELRVIIIPCKHLQATTVLCRNIEKRHFYLAKKMEMQLQTMEGCRFEDSGCSVSQPPGSHLCQGRRVGV